MPNSRTAVVVAAAVVIAFGFGVFILAGGGGGDAANGDGGASVPSQDAQEVDAPATGWDVTDSPGQVTAQHSGGDSVNEGNLYVQHSGQRFAVPDSAGTGYRLTVTAEDLGTDLANGETVYLVWVGDGGEAVLHEHELSGQ